ncbi:hypothetical protein B0H16DRAFT_205178 [Mycena metata]|uniref:F-box domain-containing protein n=1 Tax=Mycena metata TaxID=1033252 RepID=A0AAD7HYW4_9AGAR|nr:hypothetical protein B0H16DRAFT_205178 [Mycena metata]
MALFFLERPFSHLTSTNTAPTDAEISEIQQIMSRGRAHVRDLGIEIDRLARAIAALRQERRDVQNRVDLHAAILSPIRRFPAEILGQIFHWTLPSAKARFMSFTAQSPWNISRVCSRWRAICVDSPDLWSHIRIHASRIFPVAALRIQLERSKPRPISIYFSWDGTDSNIDALAVLVMSSTRWESASLIRPSGAMVLGLNTLSEREGCLPLLRELNFKRSDDRETCTAFETAPQLTDVSIDGSHRRLLVPLAQLTRLRLQMPRTPERLRLAVNLLQLTLGKASLTLPPPVYDEPIELSHLQMLFIADGRYLSSFRLPALEDICIKENAICLPAFIDRSPCRLQKITLIEELPNILEILDRAPALREIRLRHPAASRRRRQTVALLNLCVLQLNSGESTRCPYNITSELQTAVEWVSGKSAQALYDGWRADYPGEAPSRTNTSAAHPSPRSAAGSNSGLGKLSQR